jgi:Zn-dependent peptidase ImmA (M78 family)
MALDAAYLRNRIVSLLNRYKESSAALRPPIDPYRVAQLCGIQIVERRMIPEAVTSVVDGSVVIYLQDNFTELPGMKSRRRFTLSHEICHTLFYNLNGDSFKKLPGTPRGESLEQLCHLGAGELLVPELLFRQATADEANLNSDLISRLARDFEVSSEVVIRRINELNTPLKNAAALILLANSTGKLSVKSFCHGPWLLAHAPKLRIGMDFEPWVRHVLPAGSKIHDGGQWSRTAADRVLTSRFIRTPSFSVFEIRCSGHEAYPTGTSTRVTNTSE